MEMHLGARPLDIRSRQGDSFEDSAEWFMGAVLNRGLRATVNPSARFLSERESYLDTLPTFGGSDFLKLVNDRLSEQSLSGESSPVRILDIGYGTGRFLLDCRDEWGESVELIGYGNSAHTVSNPGDSDGLIVGTKPELIAKRVNLIEGDVIDLSTKLGVNKADFIVSSRALMYVFYPQWELIKKVYRALKPGGIALLDYDFVTGHLVEGIVPYLVKNGYEFEVCKDRIAFKKTHPDIKLPIRTVGWNSQPQIRIMGQDLGIVDFASRLP